MKKYLLVYSAESDYEMKGFEVVRTNLILEETGGLLVDSEKHLNHFGFRISDEEILTFKSHVGLWQRFISSDNSYCLIIEDNINLTVKQIKLFTECVCGISVDWDVFFPYEFRHVLRQTLGSEVLNPTVHEKYDYNPYLLGYEWGNSIYALTKKGAQKLLSEISCIGLRLDDSILELAVDKVATVLFSKVNFFDIANFPRRPYLQRKLLIREAVMNFNVWNEKDEADLQLLLKSVSDIARICGIKLILQGGSHLGYVRHGGKMAWDDDIDLGIEANDFQKFRVELSKSALLFDRFVENSSDTDYYKIWLNNGSRVAKNSYCFPFIDLWLYHSNGEDLVFKNGIVCPLSAKYPFKKIVFESVEFWIVGNSLEVLDSRYRDWRTKIRIYNWNHREESQNRHQLSCDILVNSDGRLLETTVEDGNQNQTTTDEKG